MVRAGLVLACAAVTACVDLPAVLTQLVEARRLVAVMHVEFTKASEASNRAVMAETDDASSAAAGEARRARQAVGRDAVALLALLRSLGYGEDLRVLDSFTSCFQEYGRLDDEVLPLAVENTNVKAQRLSFGPAREAADAFRASLQAATALAPSRDASRVEAVASRAVTALLEIRVLQAPHIAASDEAAMGEMERQMVGREMAGRQALRELRTSLPPGAGRHLDAAAGALDRFVSVNREIVSLSRRNSNVRSLALSLGRKRLVTAQCHEHLQALERALAGHEFKATR